MPHEPQRKTMPVRQVGTIVVQTRVEKTAGGFRLLLFTRSAQGPPELVEWPLPRDVVYASEKEANEWARWLLLGLYGFDSDGRPQLSAL